MGGVVSKIKENIRARIDEQKALAYQGYERRRQAVVQSITDKRDAVINRVTGVIDNIVNEVVSRRDQVVDKVIDTKNRVIDTKNRVCARVTAIKNGIEDRVTRTVNAVIHAKNVTQQFVIDTKNAVVTKVTNTKNAVVHRYVTTRDAAYAKYHAMRNAKLTRWEKVKYGTLAAFIFLLFAIAALCLLDVYLGDYERAENRLKFCWFCVETVWEWTWFIIFTILTYLWIGLCYALDYTWQGIVLAAQYTWIGITWAWHYTLMGCKVIFDYTVLGAKYAAFYMWAGIQLVAYYTWAGTCATASYAYQGGTVVAGYGKQAAVWSGDRLMEGAKYSAECAKEGSIIAADYTKRGAKYAYEHGSVALKEGSIRFIKYLFYFMTNFRTASGEAAVWLWETSKAVAAGSVYGIKTACVYAVYYTWEGICLTYYGIIEAVRWTYFAVVTSKNYTLEGLSLAYYYTKLAITEGFSFTVTSIAQFYRGTVYVITSLWDGSLSFASIASQFSKSSYEFLSEWTIYIGRTVWNVLSVVIGDYGFRFVKATGKFLGQIFAKFFVDLAVYVVNFIRVTSNHVYSVIYFIVSFIYYIVTGVGAIIRVFLQGAVYCTTAIFKVIIYVLEETLFVYAYIMHKYNTYREALFLVFIGLMSTFCTGLLKHRRRLQESDNWQEDSESSESEAEDVPDETGDGTNQRKERTTIRRRDLVPVLAPDDDSLDINGGNATRAALMPSHDYDSSDEDMPDFTGHEDLLNAVAGLDDGEMGEELREELELAEATLAEGLELE